LHNPFFCIRFHVLDNGTPFEYDAIQSSVTILAGSLEQSPTYQFVVTMTYLQNASINAFGYVLVKVEDTNPQLVVVA
jgi:hypothetical protein